VARGLPEERPAVLEGVLAGGVGQLVDEALGDERVLGGADRPPPWITLRSIAPAVSNNQKVVQ